MSASGGQDLLLRLLRREPPGASLAGSDAAWLDLLAVAPADLHPYLAQQTRTLAGRERVPEPVRRRFETANRAAAIGYLHRQALLRRLVDALDRAGVSFVVLKGVVLAHLAYPEPALRPMGDIDLWIRPEALDAGVGVLLEAGLTYPERLVGRTAAATRIDQSSTRVLESPETGVVVEVHGILRSMASLTPGWEEEAWARTEHCDLGGVVVRTLHPEDMLTHLAMHGSAHHRFEGGLQFLLDISLWLERAGDQCDWPTMQARWERGGCRTWVEVALVLAAGLLRAPVPAAVVGRAGRPPEFDELLNLARAQVLEPTVTLPPSLAKLSATPSLAGRLRWVVHRLTGWYWTGPAGAHRSPLTTAREAARRMGHDLRHKLPPYLRGVWDGSLRGGELRRRMALAVGRERMAELVAQAEARQSSATGPAP